MCECVSRDDESDVARGVYGEATFFGAFGTISSDLTHVGGLERAQRQQQLALLMPPPNLAAAAAARASTPETQVTTLTLTRDSNFDLGGRGGNIVTFSSHESIHKGFRLLRIDGHPVGETPAAVQAAVDAARRSGRKFKADFAGGKPTGGGGMALRTVGNKIMAAAPSAAAARENVASAAKTASEKFLALEKAAADKAAADKAAAWVAAEKAKEEKARADARVAAADKAAAEAKAALDAKVFADARAAADAKAAAEAKKAAAEKAAAEKAKAEAEAKAKAAAEAKAAEATATRLEEAWKRSNASSAAPAPRPNAFKSLPPRAAVQEPQAALLKSLSTRWQGPQPNGNGPIDSEEEEEEEVCTVADKGPCDKCDGPHATARCPHFKKARDKHRDAWQGYSGEGGGGKNMKAQADRVAKAPLLRGARIVRQPGDGSCLFHSLSFGARKLGSSKADCASAASVREACAAFLERCPNAEIGGTPLREWIQWESGGDVKSYVRRMRGKGEWGGAIEIAVVSRCFNVSVHVFEKAGGDTFKLISAFDAAEGGKSSSSGGKKEPVVRVLYSGRCHYDALEVPGE